MRKRNLIITGLVGVVLAAAAVWLLKPSAGSDAVTTEASVPAALTVQATVPKVETWPVEVQASGWLAPWVEAVIASELGGERIMVEDVEALTSLKQALGEPRDRGARVELSVQVPGGVVKLALAGYYAIATPEMMQLEALRGLSAEAA